MTKQGRPKLNLCTTHTHYRKRIIQELSKTKFRLLYAYSSGDIRRINLAKSRIARYLHELADSPELGGTYTFKFGEILSLYIQSGHDDSLEWIVLDSLKDNWSRLADYIERSIEYESDADVETNRHQHSLRSCGI